MQEARSQLEIQLQKWNSELQGYNKPQKDTSRKKSDKQTHLEAAILEMKWWLSVAVIVG